ncbi:hypothetical protein M413DRAFT_23397 [Hebeloma cylindrosporum]|uniref:G-protein coupled receptors family 1 profile domain-containing protein n=1 Tax=Hebeloma cylindrosporum TaxID=76867 RepID=A0A0C3CEF2_HEBCY|nr:hypothetical protein M413DRAFT_23397 [Hebeloma cylindrosporum h7]
MPLDIPDEFAPYLKTQLLSTIFSAVAYGIVIVLSANCFHLFQKKRGVYSNRMRIFLPIYILVMLFSSTWELVGSICLYMQTFTPVHASEFLYRPFGLLVAMCGADWFMIWRCLVLYQDISQVPRVAIILLLSLLSLASLVFGIAVFVEDVTFMVELIDAYAAFMSLSAFANIILATLIVVRLVYHQRNVRNALGAEHGSPYTNIITIGLYASMYFWMDSPLGTNFMFDITPHICVISPLLIVYRVALGRAVAPTLRPSEQVMAQIRLNIPLSNPSGQGIASV